MKADPYQLKIYNEGVEVWNKWRNDNPEVEVILNGVDFSKADISNINLTNAELFRANFYKTNLENAKLVNANLTGANFYKTNLNSADLTGANLQHAGLVNVNLKDAILFNCKLYGFSAWDLVGQPKQQSNLIITAAGQPEITVDDLQLAQFIYLLLNNNNIRNLIDTITSKAILILGRFTHERKAVLNAMRKALEKLNYTAIIFDFDKPAAKDITGTIETLARMVKFIIADLTDPKSVPHELATLVPHLRTTPIQLIKLKGNVTYSMFEDYIGSYPWLLKPFVYKNNEALIDNLEKIISPANKLAEKYRRIGKSK